MTFHRVLTHIQTMACFGLLTALFASIAGYDQETQAVASVASAATAGFLHRSQQ